MEINVRSTGCGSYKSVKIICDQTTIEIGLLDEDECKELAISLISAAEDLLPIDNLNEVGTLCEIRESIS